MAMPNMTGVDLSKELLQLRPDIPIILCTGFSERIDRKKASEMGIREMLMKPILLSVFGDTIQRVLSQSTDDPPQGT
jgi:CheY-like chemotaxis protein